MSKFFKKNNEMLSAVVANSKGEIFDLEGYAAVGMSGKFFSPLMLKDTISMPHGGELMFLPDRSPVLLNLETREIEIVSENPYVSNEPIYPAAAFNSPGYMNTHSPAFQENIGANNLPLFAYGAIGWAHGSFRSAAVRVEWENRQDLRLMDPDKIALGIKKMQAKMPGNRLRKHLEKCALYYGCPAAKNFYLGRFEAPLPTSRKCNANCLGCISLQKDSMISSPQERISFTPSPEEITEIALEHIQNIDKSVVSFGQGCEGDPLLAADVIGPAISKIRSITSRGTINMNTNAGNPLILEKLLETGLDSIRVSINSVRPACYHAYFRPRGHAFSDVEESIDIALKMGKFVSINYLNSPGVTDAPGEVEELMNFLKNHAVDLIQWRNLNFDPLRYWTAMDNALPMGEPIGIKRMLKIVQTSFPDLKFGYFNPPKERFSLSPKEYQIF